jgi:hypothetical protein
LAREAQKGPSLVPEVDPSTSQPAGLFDPDLARVLDAWPTLPDHIKAAVMALVTTAHEG